MHRKVDKPSRARQAARRKLAELQLPRDLTMEVLIGIVENILGLKIRLREQVPGWDPKTTGTTVVKDGVALVSYPHGATPHRKRYVICHELAHLVFNHKGSEAPMTSETIPTRFGPVLELLSPEMVSAQMHRRCLLDGPDEWEAEAFADLLSIRLTWTTARNEGGPESFGWVFG